MLDQISNKKIPKPKSQLREISTEAETSRFRTLHAVLALLLYSVPVGGSRRSSAASRSWTLVGPWLDLVARRTCWEYPRTILCGMTHIQKISSSLVWNPFFFSCAIDMSPPDMASTTVARFFCFFGRGSRKRFGDLMEEFKGQVF